MLSLLLLILLGVSSIQGQSRLAPPAAASLAEDPAVTALALKIYGQMRAGKIDQALMTEAMNKELSPSVLAQTKPVFDQLGDPVKLTLQSGEVTAQGKQWVYLAEFAAAQLHVRILVMADGKVGGYRLAP